MKPDCLFCKIAHGDKDKLVWQNDFAAAFNDIHPQAPIHVLVVPKKHYETLDELDDQAQAGQLLLAVREVARKLGTEKGYRVIINVGRHGGQIVDHLHVHILGGKKFSHAEVESSAN